MLAILFAALAAALFGALSVAQRAGLARAPDAEAATVVSCLVGLAVAAPVAAAGNGTGHLVSTEIWPYLLAGLLAPGAAQLLFVHAVAAIGAARPATLIAAAPLLSAVPAFVLLDEPLRPALPVGAALIVTGAFVLSGERLLPGDFRRSGIALALGSAALIAARDNFVRWFARDDDVSGLAAGTASLVAASAFVLLYLAALRGRRVARVLRRAFPAFLLAGAVLGLAYCANLEALTRGRVTVVTPLYATEALWAVLFAALVLGRGERIGKRLVLAAILMVAGGALIGAFR